jgi:transcriptional regulator with XRE-family HTH domain
MAGKSNIQICVERARAVYEAQGQPPLLQQICDVHGLSIREFASIFGISKTYGDNILKHRTFPTLELGIAIARYWECSVEDLFGWRVDDGGQRRPLLVVDPKTNKVRKLTRKEGKVGAIELAMEAKASCGDGDSEVFFA